MTASEKQRNETQTDNHEMAALMSKWDKKSTGSTDSLIDSDLEPVSAFPGSLFETLF
jgi:hypothetical protein